MAGICYVAGALPLEEFVPAPDGADLLAAADQGYQRLRQAGLEPGLVVGDFDSLGEAPRTGAEVIPLPRIKDETDMGFALRTALERGWRRFVLLGGVGGRLEHTLSNLELLVWLGRQGARGVLVGGGSAVAHLKGGQRLALPREMRGFVSVFSAGGTARGVTLEGLKYPLFGEEMDSGFPMGVSNEFLGLESAVSLEEGELWVMWDARENPPRLWLLPALGE